MQNCFTLYKVFPGFKDIKEKKIDYFRYPITVRSAKFISISNVKYDSIQYKTSLGNFEVVSDKANLRSKFVKTSVFEVNALKQFPSPHR